MAVLDGGARGRSLNTALAAHRISWGIEMKASILSFRAAVLMVIAGMVWGIVMGISQDHSTLPAHAHLNLLGWVSLFLFGIYYHLHPTIDVNRLASVQVWIWIVGTIILTIGVGLVHSRSRRSDSRGILAGCSCRHPALWLARFPPRAGRTG